MYTLSMPQLDTVENKFFYILWVDLLAKCTLMQLRYFIKYSFGIPFIIHVQSINIHKGTKAIVQQVSSDQELAEKKKKKPSGEVGSTL